LTPVPIPYRPGLFLSARNAHDSARPMLLSHRTVSKLTSILALIPVATGITGFFEEGLACYALTADEDQSDLMRHVL